MKLKHTCTFESGLAVFDNLKSFRDECRTMDGSKGYITLHRASRSKSNQQNKYYWGCVIPILSKHLGYSPDEVNSALGFKFLKFKKGNGLTFIKSVRMSEWEKKPWEEYMEKIRRWAAEYLDCQIPLPNEVDYTNIMEPA